MEINLATIAGFISTVLFALGTLPMLVKAFRTRNLASYSLGNILLSNVGNIINSIYVFQLPPGPVWFLHIYNTLSTGLMLVWYLQYEGFPHWAQPVPRPQPTLSMRKSLPMVRRRLCMKSALLPGKSLPGIFRTRITTVCLPT